MLNRGELFPVKVQIEIANPPVVTDHCAFLLNEVRINSGSYPVSSFEATDVGGIQKEFRRSIDEYIASCKEDGLEPVKPFQIPA